MIMELASEVKITVEESGKFRMETDTGNVLIFGDQEFVKVLEETVKQIRGKEIKITSVSTQSRGDEKMVPADPKAAPPKPIINADNIGEYYHNGGLGPRIGPGSDNGFGHGV